MHTYHRGLLVAAAMWAMCAAPANAHALSLYGLTGCFAGAVGATSVQNGVSSGNCADVESSTIRYGGFPPLGYYNSLSFSRSSPPGAAGDQGTGDPTPISFNGASPTSFSLGILNFSDLYINQSTSFTSAYLNLSFWFTAGAGDPPVFSFNDIFELQMDYEGINEVFFEPPAAQSLVVDGRSYEFSIAGFDGDADCNGSKSTRLASDGSTLSPVVTHVCASLRDLDAGTTVPEPGSLALIAGGLFGMLIVKRRALQQA